MMGYGHATFHPKPIVQQVLQGFGGPPRVWHPKPIVEQVLQGFGATAAPMMKLSFTPAQIQAAAQSAINKGAAGSAANVAKMVSYYGSQGMPVADLPSQCKAQGGSWNPSTSICTIGGSARSQALPDASSSVGGIPTVALVAAGAVAVGAAYYFLVYKK